MAAAGNNNGGVEDAHTVCVARWPGHIEPGTSDGMMHVTDWFPTLLEIAGAKAPETTDGESLLPLLRGEGELERQCLFFHYPNYAFHRSNRLGGAIRAGRYKLIERFDDGSVELFDLQEDLGEQRDLAADRPALAADLRALASDNGIGVQGMRSNWSMATRP